MLRMKVIVCQLIPLLEAEITFKFVQIQIGWRYRRYNQAYTSPTLVHQDTEIQCKYNFLVSRHLGECLFELVGDSLQLLLFLVQFVLETVNLLL